MSDNPLNQITRTGVSRRTLLRLGLSGTALGALAACTPNGNGNGNGVAAGAGDFPETPPWNFVFVNHVTTNPFFVPTVFGIEDASAMLGTEFQWTGSEGADESEMLSALDSAIAADADGIAISLVDEDAFNASITRALDEGIPVVSYNADAPNDRLTYIGQDLFESGREMGRFIVDLIGSGSIGLFISTPGQLNIQPRVDGAIDYIEESGADIEFETIATSESLDEQVSRVEAFYLGDTDVDGLFAVDGGSTEAVGQIMRRHDLKDEGKFGGGFDLLPGTVEALGDGIMDFAIDQQPYYQGFLPVVYLYLYRLSGSILEPPLTNTGLKFVTPENVTPYLETESRFEGDGEGHDVFEEQLA